MIIQIKDYPQLKSIAAKWFHEKWKVDEQAYLESIEESFKQGTVVPNWYLDIDKNQNIRGGCGIIENDFHPRKDCRPNLCAVYVEKNCRNQRIAGNLLDYVCQDMHEKGIDTLYLITGHDHFYERYGWQFYAMVKGDFDDELSRLYVHHYFKEQ